jgi:hypothetical protein
MLFLTTSSHTIAIYLKTLEAFSPVFRPEMVSLHKLALFIKNEFNAMLIILPVLCYTVKLANPDSMPWKSVLPVYAKFVIFEFLDQEKMAQLLTPLFPMNRISYSNRGIGCSGDKNRDDSE